MQLFKSIVVRIRRFFGPRRAPITVPAGLYDNNGSRWGADERDEWRVAGTRDEWRSVGGRNQWR